MLFKELCIIFPPEIVNIILWEYSNIPISKEEVKNNYNNLLNSLLRYFIHKELLEYFLN